MKITNEGLGPFGARAMGIYAEEVNLGRAVPDMIDGLKPVQRRILWAASQVGKDFVKTARLVGSVMGLYHPHGDASTSGAITTMVQSNVSPIAGKGGWGNLIDPASAMRYTNCCLSHYGWTFFESEYIAKEVTSFVPNYDDTTVEPVSLPALMPNVLLNGGEGIGVGTTTCLPTFTPESVVAVMTRVLKGEKLTAVDFAKTLKFAHVWGGHVVNTKENRQAWLKIFTASQSSIQFEADLTVDRDAKAIEIDDWPPGLNPIKFIERVRAFPEVEQAYNHQGATGFRIEMRKDYNYVQFDKLVEKVQGATRVKRAFKINVTHRQARVEDGITLFETKYLSLSVPQLLIAWLRERIALEKRSLEYRIRRQQGAIDYSELLIYAASKLDVIFKALKSKDPKAYIVRGLKITEEQAEQILELKVRQLSALDSDQIKGKLAAQQKVMAQYKAWLAKPRSKVIADTQRVLDAIAKDRKFQSDKDKPMTLK